MIVEDSLCLSNTFRSAVKDLNRNNKHNAKQILHVCLQINHLDFKLTDKVAVGVHSNRKKLVLTKVKAISKQIFLLNDLVVNNQQGINFYDHKV